MRTFSKLRADVLQLLRAAVGCCSHIAVEWFPYLTPDFNRPSQEGIQGGSTETVVLSKPAAAGAAGQNSSAAQPAAGPGAGSSGGRGGSSGEDTIIIPGAKARPLAGTGPAGSSGGQQQRQQQHTGSLAELYANRTSHTFSSSSTGTAGGSQETTVALRHTPNAGAQLAKWFHAQASGVPLAVGARCKRASIAAFVLWRAAVVGRRHFIQRP